MRTVEEIRADIDACYANLNHLVRVNSKWTTELPSIDRETRPVGYANQVEGIRQQETAFSSESKRLIVLKAEEWLSSLGHLESNDLDSLKDALKAASELVKRELKSVQDEIGNKGDSLFE